MSTVTLSHEGQVVIPEEIRRQLGIVPGSELELTLEGNTIRIEPKPADPPSSIESGYGLLVCKKPGQRRLADFDIAQAMQDAADDRT